MYDVFVINPSGDVGFLPGGFIVSANQMPSISSITPDLLTAGTQNTVTLTGSNFGASATSLVANCINFYNSSITATISAVINTVTATSVGAQFDLSSIAPPSSLSCVVTFTNSEGLKAKFSTVRVQSTAGGAGWLPDVLGFNTLVMNQPRTAHSTALVRPTPNSAFLYAFGGLTTGIVPTNTVEYAALDEFGRVKSTFTNARSDHNLQNPMYSASATVAGR